MKLFEVKQELQEIDDLFNSIEPDPETGELIVDEDLTKRMFELHDKKNEILLYLASKHKELQVKIDGFKSVVAGLNSRKKTAENRAKWLSEIIRRELSEGDKLEDSQAKLSWRKSEKVEILNIKDIPGKFLIPEIKADVSAIKKELKLIGNEVNNVISSKEIPGCQIRKNMNLQIK